MPGDRWTGSDEYEQFIGRWSRPVGREFLSWLAVPAGSDWVDVGCGTGALSGLILERCQPASIVGVDPSPEFIAHASTTIDDERVRFVVGGASALPVADRAADAVVAGLVLNFIPDLPSALAEMIRVGAGGAVVAGYVWDYTGGMQLLCRFWDVAVDLDAGAAAQSEGIRFPICAPEPMRAAFESSGLDDVVVRAIDIDTPFRDFDDYWMPFLGEVGPAPGYLASLAEPARDRLRERLRATLPISPDGSIPLVARAWAVRGRTPD